MGGRDDVGYAPLRDYAALGDGRTVALVAVDLDVDWLPVPMLDAAPAFAALLDPERGGRIRLAAVDVTAVEREYLPDTNVLRSRVTTATGVAEVVDSLNSGVAGRLPWTELARRITGLEGTVDFEWSVEPGELWRTHGPWLLDGGDPVLRVGTVQLAVRGTDHHPEVGDGRLSGRVSTTGGAHALLAVIGVDAQPVPLADPQHIEDRIDLSVQAWRTWTRSCSSEQDLPRHVIRHALALKLLISSPAATIAAAATTSLPEAPAGGKNWDYRYSWLRDTSFTVGALQRLGVREEVHAATSRLLQTLREDGPVPPVFTTLAGGSPTGQRRVDAPGWRGIGPVVEGNDARTQLQLGVFGDLFALIDSYLSAGHVLDQVSARAVADMADHTADMWRLSDAGLWELPDEQHYTSSKMSCWRALSVAARLADAGALPGRAERWRTEADRIADWIRQHCWSETRHAWTFHAGTDDLDCSVLLGHDFDNGPRMSSTIDALRSELGAGPLLYRYSGMAAEEGCFVACSFWMVSALVAVGRRGEAHDLLGELRPLPNDFGLLAEMVDPATGEFLGNLPQALSHLAALDAELTLLGR
jgi:GH15 family glucan-1,4-alpha-glucosidase